MLILKIIMSLIVLIQLFLVIYLPTKFGRVKIGIESKEYKDIAIGEWLDNDCGGIWYEYGQATYNKYYNYFKYNLIIAPIILIITLATFFGF